MHQVPGPDPAATVRVTVRLEGAVIGQFYVEMNAEAWFHMFDRPWVNTGDMQREGGGRSYVDYEWIGPHVTTVN